MKTATKKKPAAKKATGKKPKSNMKAGYGMFKGDIIEAPDCWTEDLKRTIFE